MPSFHLCGDEGFCFLGARLLSCQSNLRPPHLVSNQQKYSDREAEGKLEGPVCGNVRFGLEALAAACAVAIGHGGSSRAVRHVSVISYNAGTGRSLGIQSRQATALGNAFHVYERSKFPGPVDPFDPPYLAGADRVDRRRRIVDGAIRRANSERCRASVRTRFHCLWQRRISLSDFNAGKQLEVTLFGAATPGSTRVSVSADNRDVLSLWITSPAPTVDSYFPTDGAGTFGFPVESCARERGVFQWNDAGSDSRAICRLGGRDGLRFGLGARWRRQSSRARCDQFRARGGAEWQSGNGWICRCA
jgi:hypothetical protein